MTTITAHNTDVYVAPIDRLPGEYFASVRYMTQWSNSGAWNSTGDSPQQAVLNAWSSWTDHWAVLASVFAHYYEVTGERYPWPNRYFSES